MDDSLTNLMNETQSNIDTYLFFKNLSDTNRFRYKNIVLIIGFILNIFILFINNIIVNIILYILSLICYFIGTCVCCKSCRIANFFLLSTTPSITSKLRQL